MDSPPPTTPQNPPVLLALGHIKKLSYQKPSLVFAKQGLTAYSTKEKHCGVTNSPAAYIYDMQRRKLALVLAPPPSLRQDGRESACVFRKTLATTIACLCCDRENLAANRDCD